MPLRTCLGSAFVTVATIALAHGVLGCGSGTGSEVPIPDAGSLHAKEAGADSHATSDSGSLHPGHDGAVAVDAADASFCSQTGPVVQLPGAGGKYNECTSQLASTLFENALCTCNNATIAGYLQTTAFNSSAAGDAGISAIGAAVGINNSYTISAGYTNVGGSLSIDGPNSVAFIGYLKTEGDFRLAGVGTIPGYTNIGRNGWLEGNFTDLGPASFAGDLHHEATVIAIPLSVTGSNTMAPVTVTPPCPCEASQILDVAAVVAQGLASNDDAKIGLSPSAWSNVAVIEKATLPCGRYYLDSLRIVGSLEVTVTGRVALFVGADITVIGNLQFHLDPGAEIDIFIENDLNLVGLAVFGDKANPADTRIYVGGSGNVNLVGAGEFVGNLYAPLSTVTAPGYLDVYGAIFSNNFQIPGYADFNYDAAITQVGNNCPP